MSKLISFKTDDGHLVYVEATDTENGLQQISQDAEAVVSKATDTLSEALEPVKSISQSILKSFTEFVHAPDELEVELGIKISAEAGIVITKAAVEGNFKIKLKWVKVK